jgi:predicted dithiol-disulfide oxidoreductase (DUF899 family)
MTDQDFTTAFVVDKTPKEVFDAINNVRGWWIDKVDGDTSKLNDEFSVRFWDVHYSKHKITELVPNTKVAWLTTDSQLNFIEDKTEWNGSEIIFDITPKGNQTEVRFTQVGLSPQVECYNDCSNAWNGYIQGSLQSLISTGVGKPTKMDD